MGVDRNCMHITLLKLSHAAEVPIAPTLDSCGMIMTCRSKDSFLVEAFINLIGFYSSSRRFPLVEVIKEEEPHISKMPLNMMHSWEASLHFRFFNNGLEQILDSFQKLVHGDMRNLGIEISRQFYLLEMKMSKVMLIILENLAKLMKNLKSLRKEDQQLQH
ncbi:hypothetical protein ABKV19_024031 [Rosa sericea]